MRLASSATWLEASAASSAFTWLAPETSPRNAARVDTETLRRVLSSVARDWSARARVSRTRFSVANPAKSGMLNTTPTLAAPTRVLPADGVLDVVFCGLVVML
jgi:hypothetical protein